MKEICSLHLLATLQYDHGFHFFLLAYNVRNMSGWIFVDSAKGLSIKVDSKSTVELTVYSDKVQGDVKFQGLCGNLNRDPSGKSSLQNCNKHTGYV